MVNRCRVSWDLLAVQNNQPAARALRGWLDVGAGAVVVLTKCAEILLVQGEDE